VSGYWVFHAGYKGEAGIRRSKFIDASPGRWVRFVMLVLLCATWHDRSKTS
jgi:hypothetical protein